MFSISFDRQTGIVRCEGGGFVTATEVLEHNVALKKAIFNSRRYHDSARVLYLAINPVAQTNSMIDEVKTFDLGLRLGDRFAMTIPVGLAKLQTVRAFQRDEVRFFDSEQAALTWLGE